MQVVTDEIAEGVETLQITYGEDTSGDRVPDVYVTANGVGDWTNVVSVRAGLLFRTVDEYGGDIDDSRYAVNGATICPVGDPDPPSCDGYHAVDRRQRRVFENAILMRNMQ